LNPIKLKGKQFDEIQKGNCEWGRGNGSVAQNKRQALLGKIPIGGKRESPNGGNGGKTRQGERGTKSYMVQLECEDHYSLLVFLGRPSDCTKERKCYENSVK